MTTPRVRRIQRQQRQEERRQLERDAYPDVSALRGFINRALTAPEQQR